MPVTPPFQYCLESQSPIRAVEGKLRLQGWIAGLGGGLSVRLCLDPGRILSGQAGLPRPDVAAVHPELPGAADSGFSIDAQLNPGFHLATLEYRRPGEEAWIPFHTLSVISQLSPLLAELDGREVTMEPDPVLHVRGWCFHPQSAIECLTLQFGSQEAEMGLGDARPDVAAAYPQFSSAEDAGFSGHLRLKPGQGPLRLIAKLANGSIRYREFFPALDIPDLNLQSTRRMADHTRASLIRLPQPEAPEVSIIIPIYNQLDLTLACLESLVRHAGPTPFEVIIIDDRSDPHVAESLGLVQGLRLHSNETNQGFVLNCNRGAQQSKGKHVLFLNNDTEVTSGWLEAMLAVFRERPRAGAVGAKLVYPDGRLQEAGGLLWQDASGVNFGKQDDPDRPEYNYLRQVDYCSGACLLVPRQLFLELGGFDTRYCPAYYEDADLAFTIRAAGYEVYYQPAARIIHYEGVSSGTDVRHGVKRHQVVNREKFAAKWAGTLHHHGADATMQNVARDRYAPARILVIDACALTPDADSGSLRMFNLLLMLATRGLKVTFAAENLQSYEPYSTQLRLAGVEHLGVPHVYNLGHYLETNAYAFDVIILSRKQIAAQFLDLVRRSAPSARLVFDTVDLMFLRLERQAKLEQSARLQDEAQTSKSVELALCAQSDLVFVVSPIEASLLAQHIPAEKIALVSNIHRTYPGTTTFAERNGLLFVGGYQHPPNVDAVDFFLDAVLPLIRPRLPDMAVHIIGSKMPDRWHRRVDRHTHLHGFVADLTPLYDRVRLAIAPLRYGAGVKGKVNQSMAHGVPVVATTMASEGMHLVHDRDVLIADQAEDFAEAVVRLHEDPVLWQRIATGGLQNIEQHFSFKAVEQELIAALDLQIPAAGAPLRPLPRRPAAPYQPGQLIRFGRTGNAGPYAREGWSQPEEASCWMVGAKAVLELELPAGSMVDRIKAVAYPFLLPPALPHQRLALSVNGHALPPETTRLVRAEPTEIEWPLPPDLLRGTDRLVIMLHSPDAISPKALGASPDERNLSFALLEMTIFGPSPA